MSFLNNVLRGLVDLMMMPFRSLPGWVSLVPISFVFGIVALLVWKHCSNQEGLQRTKDRIAACFYEIRLFNDDLRSILRAQIHLLGHNLRYLGLNLVPFAVMFIPTLPFIAQWQFHYGYEGLEPGQQTVVSVQLQDSWEGTGRPAVELRAPEGVTIESGPVWIPAKKELAWRVVGEQNGHFDLELVGLGDSVSKSLVVSDEIVRRSPVRQQASFLGQLLYPAEPPIHSDSPIEAIRLNYPTTEVEIFGFGLQWMIWFVILSIVFALMLRKRLGVTF